MQMISEIIKVDKKVFLEKQSGTNVYHLLITARLINDITYDIILEKDHQYMKTELISCYPRLPEMEMEPLFQTHLLEKQFNLSLEDTKRLEIELLEHPKVKLKALLLEETRMSLRRVSRLKKKGKNFFSIVVGEERED